MKPLSREARLAREICTATGADCVFLALRRPDDRLVTLAQVGPATPDETLEGTWPADEQDLRTAFPNATLADAAPIADGLLVPVRDGFGLVIGAVGTLHARPIDDREAVEHAILQHAAPASHVLERSRIDSELQQLVGPHGASAFEARLQRILTSLARVTHAPIAFVTELVDESTDRGRALMILNRGEVQGPFEYEFDGAPCEDVYTQRLCFHTNGVRELYPHFPFLQQVGAEGYLGLPIEDASKRTLGHVGVVSDRAFPEDLVDLARIRIFASLLGSEVSRSRADAENLRSVSARHEAQRLESLGLFAGGVAHDFNNLLAAISTSLELASTEPDVPSAVSRHLDAIRRSTTAAAGLSNELLAYAGRGKHEVEPLDLSESLEGMEHLFTTAAGNITLFRLKLSSDLPMIQANRTQVGQLAMNLTLNAIESVRSVGGGLVDLSTSLVRTEVRKEGPVVGSAPPGNYVVLKVTDTGQGISPDDAPHIFDPFRSTKRQGRGLGLAIVQGIVQSHGAALFLESREGAGTTINVWFPAGSAQAPMEEHSVRARTLLVVEDQEIVLETTKRLCEHLGHTVITAPDGSSAISTFERQADEIDLVLLDVNLPDLDGRVVLRALRAHRPDVPILLTSGYVREAARKLTANDPLTGFLKKPFRGRNVEEAIAALDEAARTSEP